MDQLFEMFKVSNTQSMQTTADYVYDMSENVNIQPSLFIYFTIYCTVGQIVNQFGLNNYYLKTVICCLN